MDLEPGQGKPTQINMDYLGPLRAIRSLLGTIRRYWAALGWPGSYG